MLHSFLVGWVLLDVVRINILHWLAHVLGSLCSSSCFSPIITDRRDHHYFGGLLFLPIWVHSFGPIIVGTWAWITAVNPIPGVAERRIQREELVCLQQRGDLPTHFWKNSWSTWTKPQSTCRWHDHQPDSPDVTAIQLRQKMSNSLARYILIFCFCKLINCKLNV